MRGRALRRCFKAAPTQALLAAILAAVGALALTIRAENVHAEAALAFGYDNNGGWWCGTSWNYRMRALKDAVAVAVVGALCIVGIAFFFGSPSEADAKQAVDGLLRCLLNDVSFRFIEFRKTGGNERSEFGMHWYEVRYHAVVELPSGIVGKKKSDNEQFLANMNSMTQQLSFAEHGFRIIKGDIVYEYMLLQADSVVNFKKVDGRWVGDRGC